MRATSWVGVGLVAALVAMGPTAMAKKPRIHSGTLDDGRLEVSYFGEPREFREAEEVDYLWVKEGFELKGKSLHIKQFPDPTYVGENKDDVDENDRRLGKSMAADMADWLVEGWDAAMDGVEASSESGDVVVEGRIVDVSTGSVAAKVIVGFGAGSGGVTFDLKFTDAKTGELLVALHHRVVSGSVYSDTRSKFDGWVGEFAGEVNKLGLQKMYAKGDSIKD